MYLLIIYFFVDVNQIFLDMLIYKIVFNRYVKFDADYVYI